MTTLISNNLSNPKSEACIKSYSELYKSRSLDFDLTIDACAHYVNRTIQDIDQKGKNIDQKGKSKSNYGKLLRFKNILELNIDAKEHYYTNTFFGKIDAFFQTFFKDKFGFKTSIEKAREILGECDAAIQENYPSMVLSKEDQSDLDLKSRIDLAKMHATAKKQVYVHSVGKKSTNPNEILFAKPNGDVYCLSRLGMPLANGAARYVYKGHLYTPGSHYTRPSKKEIAILTTLPPADINSGYKPIDEIKVNTQNIQREQILLRQLRKIKDITHNRDFFMTQINDVPVGFAMTDLYKLGNLEDFLKGKNLLDKEKLSLMASLSNSIADLHAQNKLHRDIKNKNTLVVEDNNGLKTVLIDFECCIDSNDKERKKEAVGTIEYWSPEYLTADNTTVERKDYKTNDDYYIATDKAREIAIANVTNPAIDMWALGLIYYRICYGVDLIAEYSPEEKLKNEGKPKKAALQDAHDYIKQNSTTIFPNDLMGNTIKRMLAINPNERLTASQLNAFWKEHPTGQ